jgi:hypothetical protein
MLEYFVISMVCSFGLSILLVEKNEDWPLNLVIPKIKNILGKLNKNLPNMFECTVCCSVWTTLIIEIFMFLLFGYFFWPISAFATISLSWFVIEFLNAIDKPESTENKEIISSMLDTINEAMQEEPKNLIDEDIKKP